MYRGRNEEEGTRRHRGTEKRERKEEKTRERVKGRGKAGVVFTWPCSIPLSPFIIPEPPYACVSVSLCDHSSGKAIACAARGGDDVRAPI